MRKSLPLFFDFAGTICLAHCVGANRARGSTFISMMWRGQSTLFVMLPGNRF